MEPNTDFTVPIENAGYSISYPPISGADQERIEHEKTRQKVWSDAWVAVAGVFNSNAPEVATRWADAALKAFDERFKQL